jgi:ketosteroid isomerase-like protein
MKSRYGLSESGRENDLQKILSAAALMALMMSAAVASDEADVMVIAHQWADSFAKGDFNKSNSPCANDAVVIDDFPPHVWQGSGACSKWYKAFAAWAAKVSVIDANITIGSSSHVDINSDYAYLVSPAGLSMLKAGKPVKLVGLLTMTFRKDAESGWRITGFTWADR